MYAPDTILELKDRRSTKENPFPYDEVRVVGESPVDHGFATAWEGTNAKGVIITPLTDFASTIDEPYGKLVKLYKVKHLPEEVEIVAGTVKIITQEEQGPSPEEVFAEEAEKAGEDSRARKPRKRVISPLDGEDQTPVLPDDPSPLGSTEESVKPEPQENQQPPSPLD